MHRVAQVRALENYRIEVRFADGTHGIVDLPDLAGSGVFSLWNDYERFRQVQVGEAGELVWSEHVDLCPDSLYMRLTGKRPEDVLRRLRRELVHA